MRRGQRPGRCLQRAGVREVQKSAAVALPSAAIYATKNRYIDAGVRRL